MNALFKKIKDIVCFSMLIRMTQISYLNLLVSSGIGRNLASNPDETPHSIGLIIFACIVALASLFLSTWVEHYEWRNNWVKLRFGAFYTDKKFIE